MKTAMMRKSGLAVAAALSLSTVGHAQSADPVANHTITVSDATKGLKGTGPLLAKLDIEQGGAKLGTISCQLFEKEAPMTVANFVGLARGKRPFYDVKTSSWQSKPFYDGLVFHRVIPDFMIQGGDPLGNGSGDPGYSFGDEFAPSLSMDKPGLLAMANRGPATNGSQFFITDKAAPWLTGRHTIFGSCDPTDLVAKIARVERGARDVPNVPVVIKKVSISRGKAK